MTYQNISQIDRCGIVGYTFHVGDLFHRGHLHQLEQCRDFCDFLIVGVLTDQAVATYKRIPVIPYPWRAAIFDALEIVDMVVPQNARDPSGNIRILKPNVYFHGDDWPEIPGEEAIKELGGKLIRTTRLYDITTTQIMKEVVDRVKREPESIWLY